jgi:retron-type reverse transcriptase
VVERESRPAEFYHARIATIYKKGDTDNAANYRPISLLSSFYKIYMILIRQRVQLLVEKHLSATQYGFRPAKSTSHAIYVIRRIQEYAESTGNELFMTLLDWEKAFDKVDQKCLCEALARFNIHEGVIRALKDGYDKAPLFVQDEFGKSEKKKQLSGIRQGCPLSPYLFIMVMTCVEHDIQQLLTPPITNFRLPGTNFDMVYYADDTIIVSTRLEACKKLVEYTGRISANYGLKLNKGKCVNLNMNTGKQQTFSNQKEIAQASEATYLGNVLNYKADPHAEINQKMQEVNRTLWKLTD